MIITKILYHQISVLCDVSNIAIIGDNIFVWNDFIPSSCGNTSSIDFFTITGINVTEFFIQNPIDPNVLATGNYGNKFLKYLEPLPLLCMKFNKLTEYVLFSKA